MKYLGVDFGLKRIGLALSEGELASPLKVIEISNLTDGVNKIKEVVDKEDVETVIVGMPEGKTGQIVEKFVKLPKREGVAVEISDETLSTKQAAANMIQTGISKMKRRVNDAYSASIILQNYLDEKS